MAHVLSLMSAREVGCGHCKNLEPEYKEAAELLKDSNIKLAQINCDDNGKICKARDISGFPTLKIYSNGNVTDYKGPRKADGIAKYMKKYSWSKPPSVEAN